MFLEQLMAIELELAVHNQCDPWDVDKPRGSKAMLRRMRHCSCNLGPSDICWS